MTPVLSCVILFSATLVSRAAVSPAHVLPVSQDPVTSDFAARLKSYTDLRARLQASVPRSNQANTPAAIGEATLALAARIREARASAKPGDIFTSQMGRRLRQLLAPELQGPDGAQTAASIRETAPLIRLVVNAEYSTEAQLSTMPPNVLKVLPALPKDLEYRFVGRHLILRDALANIIVDFMHDAIP